VNFSCDSCGRLYSIADEKVQGRSFRVKCKACDHTIVVRGPGAASSPAIAPVAATSAPPPRPAAPASPEAASMSDAEMAWLAGAPEAAPASEDPAPDADAAASPEPGRGAPPFARSRKPLIAAAVLLAAAAAVALFMWRQSARRPAPPPAPPVAVAPAPPAPSPEPPATESAAATASAAKPAEPSPSPADPRPATTRSRADFQPVGDPAAGRDQRKVLKIAKKDQRLLDLLEKKQDAAPAAPVEKSKLDTARAVLDRGVVEQTIADNQSAFAACVTKAIKVNPRLKVDDQKATLMLTVQPNGTVSSSWIAEAELEKSSLGRCLVAASRRVVFPAFQGDAIDVSAPLALSAVR